MSGLTLGSLFDGSGAFPLAGLRNGITPIWASELEPFAIRVTTKQLPQVQHVGDITKLSGAGVEPVSIVTFGSPCQNLSVSGRREGLHGEKSSLFFDAVRIIREMREATNGRSPRWIVWENVFGALHSSSGADFREVLETLIRLKDPEAIVPMPEGGKWLPAGEILGDGYSLAWRVFDAAQGWGVAQRRRRVYLVVDLDGERAGSVLFESEGVSGYTSPRGGEGQAAAAGAQGSAAGGGGAVGFQPGLVKRKGGHAWEEMCGTLLADAGDNAAAVAAPVYSIQGKIIGRQPFNQHGFGVNEDVCFTLDTTSLHAVAYSMTCGSFASVNEDVAGTILHRDHKQPQIVAKNENRRYIVRKLLPQEYAVLMGMPPDWCADLDTPEPTDTDIAFWTDVFEAHRLAVNPSAKPRSRNQITKWLRHPHTDAAEYKLWGNGLVVENASFVLAGIAWADEHEKCHAICAT